MKTVKCPECDGVAKVISQDTMYCECTCCDAVFYEKKEDE